MKKIGIHGSFFGDNFGDTLFAIITNNLIKSNGCQPIFSYCSRRVFDKLPHASKGLLGFLCSDKIIFTGGGYLGEPSINMRSWHFRFAIRHGLIMMLCMLMKKRYIVAGCGVGPLSNKFTKFLVKKFLLNAEYIIVRDCKSYSFVVEDLGIKNVDQGADLVLDYIKNETWPSYKSTSHKKRIGLHIPINLHIDNLNYLFDILFSRQYDFEYIYFKDFYRINHVSEFCRNLSSKGIEFIEYDYVNAESMIGFINSLDGLITVKLHVGIVATSLGIPTLSIFSHEKSERYFSQIGYQDLICSLNNDALHQVENFFRYVDGNININIPNNIIEDSESVRNAIVNFCESD